MNTFPWGLSPIPYSGNPIIPVSGAPAHRNAQVFDFQFLINPSDATKTLLYVTCMPEPVANATLSISLFEGLASDLTSWTEYGEVLLKGTSGQFDDTAVRLGSIVYHDGTFYMFYSADPGGSATFSIGLATSTDGYTFTKQGQIMTASGNSRNDGTSIEDPAVIRDTDGTWLMVYSYRNGGSILPGLRLATSPDATTWTKVGTGDVITTTPRYAEWHQLFKHNGTYYLAMEIGSGAYPFECFLASAGSFLGPWRLEPYTLIPRTNISGDVARYHTATPFLFEHDGAWRALYCAANEFDAAYADNHWPACLATFTGRPSLGGSRATR